MRILILTDSLGLPRFIPEPCPYERTWPIMLKAIYPIIHQVSIGGATTSDILKQIHYHKSFQPDIIILQVGIVDCAPRFLNKLELDILRSLGVFGKTIIKILNHKNVRKWRDITYVSKTQFKNNLLKIKDNFDVKIIALGILPVVESYEKSLPGVSKNVNEYNEILSDVFTNFISLNELGANCIMSDGHHINGKGHLYIANQIKLNLYPKD